MMMSNDDTGGTFVFRNLTVEPFLGDSGVRYSGYGDISMVPQDVERYLWFYQVPPSADEERLAQEIASFGDKLDLVLARVNRSKPFIVFSLVDLFPLTLTGGRNMVDDAVNAFNDKALALAESNPMLKWVDLSQFTIRYQAGELVSWKYYFMSQTLFNPKLAHDFAAWWRRAVDELALKRKKCLVLDLDNTLWGGVLGEDGVDGVQIGGDYPGNAFLQWQQSLLQLYRQGVILAVCSKNNEADVLEAWQQNPYMVLRQEHFAASRINWQDKATNLNELAAELNIGLDSMVFVDDNPAERDLVRQMLPQVTVPDFPDKPFKLMSFFKELVEKYFRIYAITDEDRNKTAQYRANRLRNAQQARFADMESFLYSLDMKLDVIAADEHNLPRIAQMTQKTNQFNLTTRRYTQADVRQRMERGWKILCLSVSDRYGDSGITGAIFLEPVDDNTMNIDSLLLSCRILGKGIEDAFVKTVFNLLRLDGYRNLNAAYLPTPKNGQTANFYDRMGMSCCHETDGGVKQYKMQLNDIFEIKNYYNIRVL